jgi:hypothetical protein
MGTDRLAHGWVVLAAVLGIASFGLKDDHQGASAVVAIFALMVTLVAYYKSEAAKPDWLRQKQTPSKQEEIVKVVLIIFIVFGIALLCAAIVLLAHAAKLV